MKLFILKRIYKSQKETSFVSSLSIISVIGIAIGVSSLLIILSVFNGFENIVTKLMIGHDPHVRIILNENTDNKKIEQFLKNSIDVKIYSKFIFGKVIYENEPFEVRGLEIEYLRNLNVEINKRNSISLGARLENRLNLLDNKISVNTLQNIQNSLINPLKLDNLNEFEIVNSFKSYNKDYDNYIAYLNFEDAKILFEKNNADGFEVILNNIEKTNYFRSQLKLNFNNCEVLTWNDLHKNLFEMMEIERWIAMVIILFITIIAIISLYATMKMLIKQKYKQIGIFETIGLTKREIISVYNYYGIILSLVGIVLGVILSLVIIYLQETFHLFPLDETVYIIPAIPTKINLSDYYIVPLITFAISFISIKLSTKEIKEVSPIDSIRWE